MIKIVFKTTESREGEKTTVSLNGIKMIALIDQGEGSHRKK